jgi:hypothetical protein
MPGSCESSAVATQINLLAPELFFLFYHTLYIKCEYTATKYVIIMKRTAFLRGKNGDYIPCLKYLVPLFVE